MSRGNVLSRTVSPQFSPRQDLRNIPVSSEEGPRASGLRCSRVNSVMSSLCIWRMPAWLCGFYSELLRGSNVHREVISFSANIINWAKKEKFCQLGGAPPLSLFSSWFCTAFITITESVNSLGRWSIYKEN